jgi:ubiquinone/menaquinone biosynthesis C-methylase UbiE
MRANPLSLGLAVVLALTGAGPGWGQSQSLEEWEAETFKRQPPEAVMDAAGVSEGMVVGEVGAGKGRFTLHLARRVGPTGKILANDIDAEGLEFLRGRCSRAGLDNVETILGTETDARFPEDSLDLVFVVWTYHWFEQPVAMLQSLRPALKPGATVFMVEPDPERGPGGADHGVSVEKVRREASAAGYELVRSDDSLPWDLIFVLRPEG